MPKKIIVMSWTDSELKSFNTYIYPEKQEMAQEEFLKLQRMEEYEPSFDFRMMTQEAFLKQFLNSEEIKQ